MGEKSEKNMYRSDSMDSLIIFNKAIQINEKRASMAEQWFKTSDKGLKFFVNLLVRH